jgi:hypothetical protein
VTEHATNDWRHRAQCRDDRYDPEDWYSHLDSVRAEAATVCTSVCNVTDACLQWAAEHGIDAGTWGGVDLASDLGKKLRKRAQAEAEKAPAAPRGGRPPLRQQALFADAVELIAQGCDRTTTAGRLGITTKYLEIILRRGAREVAR